MPAPEHQTTATSLRSFPECGQARARVSLERLNFLLCHFLCHEELGIKKRFKFQLTGLGLFGTRMLFRQ
jgi:hypothetical protein